MIPGGNNRRAPSLRCPRYVLLALADDRLIEWGNRRRTVGLEFGAVGGLSERRTDGEPHIDMRHDICKNIAMNSILQRSLSASYWRLIVRGKVRRSVELKMPVHYMFQQVSLVNQHTHILHPAPACTDPTRTIAL